jgi:hypothetical protein
MGSRVDGIPASGPVAFVVSLNRGQTCSTFQGLVADSTSPTDDPNKPEEVKWLNR